MPTFELPSDADAHGAVQTAVNWRKACHANGQCVEIAAIGGAIAVRDGKNPSGAVLQFSVREWRRFAAKS